MTNEMAARLNTADTALQFILAGNAYITFRSQATGTRYTYRISKAEEKENQGARQAPRYFVSLLTCSDNTGDYTYLGMITAHVFRATKATGAQAKGQPFLAFDYVWRHLARGVEAPQAEIWHEGRCGRCGRMLTVPESIALGLGPECAGKTIAAEF